MQPLEEVVKHSGLFWPPWVVRRVLDDTLRGLVYLHSHEPPIIHRGMSVSLCLAIHMSQILCVCVCVALRVNPLICDLCSISASSIMEQILL